MTTLTKVEACLIWAQQNGYCFAGDAADEYGQWHDRKMVDDPHYNLKKFVDVPRDKYGRTIFTFEQFVASRNVSCDSENILGDVYPGYSKCMAYANDCCGILINDDTGEHYLVIGNEEYTGDLATLEPILFEWARGELWDDDK